MTQYIKPILITRLNTIVALVFILGFTGGSDAQVKTNQVGGTDNALSSVSTMRDPFWPVDFVPEEIAEKGNLKRKRAPEGVNWSKAMEQVSIQGVSSRAGNEFFAIINGQIKTVGETVSVKSSNVIYTWAVDSIAPPSSVKLRRISAE